MLALYLLTTAGWTIADLEEATWTDFFASLIRGFFWPVLLVVTLIKRLKGK